ncbi:hypothetical protein OH76DRAFT_688427 [Lentinus brumalis]|uniref:Uncharacterized protein n=1 Tax=Lentinus brumalis TaxID=2498619 RepID=A0A371D620_9APHY|nr:hypothetical protein OH76DRAFT_688427 [Polyporus brumalis]
MKSPCSSSPRAGPPNLPAPILPGGRGSYPFADPGKYRLRPLQQDRPRVPTSPCTPSTSYVVPSERNTCRARATQDRERRVGSPFNGRQLAQMHNPRCRTARLPVTR